MLLFKGTYKMKNSLYFVCFVIFNSLFLGGENVYELRLIAKHGNVGHQGPWFHACTQYPVNGGAGSPAAVPSGT
jgi:hypothetical protein